MLPALLVSKESDFSIARSKGCTSFRKQDFESGADRLCVISRLDGWYDSNYPHVFMLIVIPESNYMLEFLLEIYLMTCTQDEWISFTLELY